MCALNTMTIKCLDYYFNRKRASHFGLLKRFMWFNFHIVVVLGCEPSGGTGSRQNTETQNKLKEKPKTTKNLYIKTLT